LRSLEILKEELYERIQIPVKLFHSFFSRLDDLFRLNLNIYVIGSGVSSSVDRYLSMASKCSFVAIAIAIPITLIYTHYTAKLPLFTSLLLSLFVLPLLLLLTSIEFTMLLPKMLYINRGAIIDSKAILLFTAVALLTTGGESLQGVIEGIPKALGKDYRYFSIEIDLVRSLTKIGTPLDVALRKAAEVTPSPTIRELLSSLASISNIGGDVSSIVRLQLDRYVGRYEISIGKAVESLNVYMEIYIALALLMPVLIGSLAVLTLLHPLAGISFEHVMFFSSFLLLPVSAIAIIVLADTIVSRIRP